ncbi:MAG: hypothetical protein ABSB82_20380 [Terriglobia bacterium]|jgi:hypothetical protein
MNEPTISAGKAERYQIALDKLFGVYNGLSLERGKKGLKRVVQGAPYPVEIAAFADLRQAYTLYTGDAGFDRVGVMRSTQIFSGPTFPEALANTMNKLLLRDYQTEYRWREIVTDVTAANDFRPQTRVRVSYVSDLPDVTEDLPIPEVVVSGSESLSFSVVQKAGLLSVTRRALINDDVKAIGRTVEQIGRAAWRTLARRVWNKVITNAAYGVDGLAMFHATHGNLGAAALADATLTAARNAIFSQVEPKSAECLGLSGPFLLVVPIALEATALAINNTISAAWYHRFGEDGERIFANPLLTDTNDWYLFDISGNVPILEVSFLLGQQNPTLTQDDLPIDLPALAEDRIVFRLRHEYEVDISDFRGGYKAVVA